MSIKNVSSRLRRLTLLACFFPIAACTAGVGEEATGQGSEQALASDTWAWGYAWVNASGTVDPTYSFNSTNGVNSNSGTAGVYSVTMPNLGVSGGNVQVVSYGSAATRCKVSGWGPSGTSMRVGVYCHDVHGALAASPFVVFFNKGIGSTDQRGAHLYYSGSTVSPAWSWNSAGGTNTVTHTSTGHYVASMPGLGFSNASVHVTAYGTDAKYCKIVGYGSGSATVRCNDTNGVPADSAFSLNFTDSTPRAHMVGGHAWIDSATSASASYQKNQNAFSCGAPGTITVASFSDVTYPGTHIAGETWPTMALATAYGDDGNFCKVGSWSSVGNDYKVHTVCFTPSGATTTTRFTSSFMGIYPGPC